MDKNKKKELMHTYDSIIKDFKGYKRKTWKPLNSFLNSLKPYSLIINIGCGNCNDIKHIKNQKFIGLDFSFESLSESQKNYPKILLVQGDAEHLPFKSNKFDAGIMIATIHHLPSKKSRIKSLKELKRILKPKSKALISAWKRWQKRFFLEFFKDKLKGKKDFGDIYVPWGKKYKRFYHLFTKKELLDLIKNATLNTTKSEIFENNIFAEIKK